MRLPLQSQPVQRTIPTQPFAQQGPGGSADGERGVQPSSYGYGVQPSGVNWGQVIQSTLPLISSFF
jgi:hypothetical protein